MKKKNYPITEQEAEFVKELREHPELMERFEAILRMTQCEQGPIRRADDVEDELVEEVRKLGNTTMREWAKKSQEKSKREFKDLHPKSHCAKKKI